MLREPKPSLGELCFHWTGGKSRPRGVWEAPLPESPARVRVRRYVSSVTG